VKSTKTVAEQIFEVEGFAVEFTGLSGEDVSNRRVEDCSYQRAARSTWSVTQWKDGGGQ